MRKVFQPPSSSAGLPAAIAAAASMTALLFCVLPFSHSVNRPTRTLELRKTSAVDLPPPAEDQPPPRPPETQPPPPAPAVPQLADAPTPAVPLSADLEIAAGSGGTLAGFGDARSITAAPAEQQEAFDVSDQEKRPEAISQTPPNYPAELRKAKVDGVVSLVFVLGEDGRVQDPRVENSSRTEFEKPALDAIRKWRFRPGMKDGQPVRTFIRVPMRFKISSH